MYLPPNVHYCIEALEKEGFSCYAVGGCVRDALLGLTPHDYDLCTAAKPETIARVFAGHDLVRSGEKHGTIGVVIDGEVYEITTYRTEGDYADSRHPGWVEFVDDITLDLSRRDFTINAMAYSPTRGYADPFGGRQDLKDGVLRCVGEAEKRFSEDALRILRGVRFAVRYGLVVEQTTKEAMFCLAPLMENLARERVLDELCKLLPLVSAENLLTFAPVLTQVIPELAPLVGFDQKNPHHQYDIFTHTAQVVAGTPADLALRWAALLHDIGKPGCFSLDEQGTGHFYGHAKLGGQMADQILLRLKAPTALRQRVVLLVEQHMTPLMPDKKLLRKRLSKLGCEAVRDLLALQRADMGAKPKEETDFAAISQLLQEIEAENACLSIRDLAVSGHDLMDLGYQGPAIGQALQFLLEQVLDEQVKNDKESLLKALHQQ
jgi:tRNA nucleotidyltransferase (CCA-adding enzyme)